MYRDARFPRTRALNGSMVRGVYFKAEAGVKVYNSPQSLTSELGGATVVIPDETTVITLSVAGDMVLSSNSNPSTW